MIGFLGGTGPEGRGLALRFALAGERVVIGSRDLARAQEAARRIEARASIVGVLAATNQRVAQDGDLLFITVPYQAQVALLAPLAGVLAGKTVVSTVAPLAFEGGNAAALAVPEGSAAQQAQRLLPGARVVAAFHSVSALDLWSPARILEGDVLVCGDDAQAKAQVMGLVPRIANLRPVDAGPLSNARYVEDLTALLLNLNRIHGARAMVRIVGLEHGAKS